MFTLPPLLSITEEQESMAKSIMAVTIIGILTFHDSRHSLYTSAKSADTTHHLQKYVFQCIQFQDGYETWHEQTFLVKPSIYILQKQFEHILHQWLYIRADWYLQAI